MAKNEINYRDTFHFPDIPGQPFPVYVISRKGRPVNWKAMIYPTATAAKKYTRRKQLRFRSQQAKIFDAFINVGYFDPLIVYREFPIPIQNCYRVEGQERLFYMMDYYFPELHLAVELDSEYHDNQTKDPDSLRDEYLKKAHGISVFRIRDLHKETVQKTKFRELAKTMRTLKPVPEVPLIFNNDLLDYLKTRKM